MSTIIAAFFHAIRYAAVALIALFFASAAFAYGTRLYPVAVVDGSPVWMRTWERMIDAAEKFTNADRALGGESPLDFSLPENARIQSDIRRNTLTYIIEDKIISEEGSNFIDGFGSFTSEEVQKIMRASVRDPKEIARDVYGVSLDEYKALILAPQARRNALAGALQSRGRTLDDWLYEMKIKKSVKLYFTSYRWNGKTVE
ncbi:MAG: hypothetical protein A2131_01055 [Candidatus Sungbacteria bacterium GWC2_49_10]|uniref:Uncharacterized protein n=2 Tax=Parcubacteria group TaxID=1794811 RepID=A0A0G1ZPV5_9BACT|nr:MAG: hypothetical protein UY60_C0008G0006 [Parcubacteria group bacterium GW2011_GWB1_50_9]KKW21499.1 MAG: hypothetical protein UY61_C0004G0007 [Candidatus Adlerbacteria bacterium GW2011_GWC1_50_9]KKW33750.1 MAG: hypothetical protein UY78_C0003G0006 [Parcubacteria group bacterium GW2011_GWA1_53_13]OGZ93201.1 MAG: hypothetical protein A2131_01055 [Candidatus Sungbacteria bacterium GWC2_49_10]